MSYAEAVDRLYARGLELAAPAKGEPRRKFDLEHMRTLMRAVGDPQRSFRSVLIAGTNGKGSTAATLGSIVAAAGYRMGLYTSPHLIRVNERIQVSAPSHPTEYTSADAPTSAGPAHLLPIADDDFARLYFQVDDAAEHLVSVEALPASPSFFEVLTAVAFLYFAEQRVALAVLEVGLGGRLDATNIVDPLLSVVTDISLDHQNYLGDTLAEIAREKAGILRSNGTLVTLPQHPEVNQAIGEVAATMPEMRAVNAAEMLPSRVLHEQARRGGVGGGNQYSIRVGGEVVNVASPLGGEHQQRNLALALAAVLELRNHWGYNISRWAMEEGIATTQWPGRLEWVRPDLLLDVAHNPAGIWTLRAYLASLPEERPRTLIFSCLRDKNVAEMSQILLPLFDSSLPNRKRDHVILTPIDSPRAADVTDLLAAAHKLGVPVHAAPHVEAALNQATVMTPSGGFIVGTGSVYLVGELRRLALGDPR